MKKKIYKFVSVTVIAVAMVVSFQMSKANSVTILTMENVEALAMAGDYEVYSGDLCIGHPNHNCIWDDGFKMEKHTPYN